MPRDVLPPQVERDCAAHERRRDGGGGGAVGGAGEGVGREVPLGADLREQGRRHGLLKPAPALPDLGCVDRDYGSIDTFSQRVYQNSYSKVA